MDDIPDDTGRRYWRVSPKFWASTQGWSDDAKIVALYLLTGPHRTTEGLFRLPKAYAAADLGWSPQRLAKPFGELLSEGFIEYDDRASVCLIMKALDYQAPENPNQVTAALRKLADLPENALTSTFKGLAERYCEPLAQALPEGFGEPIGEPQALTQAPSLALTQAPSNLERFEEFWQLCPRKVGKGDAQKAWRKALKKTSEDRILMAARGLKRQYASTEARHIPHPATWLNGERWEDEPDCHRSMPNAVGNIAAALEMNQ